jgi:hypothetical protein
VRALSTLDRGTPVRGTPTLARLGVLTLALLSLAVVSGLLAACGAGQERGRRPGSALWVDGQGVPLSVADWKRLEGAGFSELFVEAATVSWDGARPTVAALQPAKSPGSVRAMLVARGEWPLTTVDAEPAAALLVASFDAVRRAVEAAGWSVAGWHLDLAGPPPADLVEAVRDGLDPRLLLAVTLPDEGLAEEALGDLVDSTDFVVAFAYGVREGQQDRDEAWHFRQVERRVRALEELGEPYLVGVVVRGVAQHVRAGRVVSELPGVSLAQLAWHRGLRVRHGFSFSGIDRQVYTFGAPSPTRLAGARLATGDSVRVMTTSSAHVQELRKQLAGWGPEHRLGELYYRLPRAGDALSLWPEQLVQAAGSERPAPRPRLTVTTLSSSRQRVMVRLTLENASREPSDLGHVESNYVELRASGGGFGRVEQGDFFRYDILAPDARGQLRRSMRNPPVLQLFAPLLGAEARLESGPIEIRSGDGLDDLQVRASFLVPYGEAVEVGPTSWTELAPRPTPTPTPRR